MKDARYQKLARLLVTYSVAVTRGDRVLVDVAEIPDEFTVELLREIRRVGGEPFVVIRHPRVTRELLRGFSDEQAQIMHDYELYQMKKMQCYIALRGSANVNETSDVGKAEMALFAKKLRPVMDYRVNKTRWVVLRWPTPSMAQSAGMSTEAFEDFYFNVCTMNYPKMAKAMIPLERRMKRAHDVHIKGPGTDLRFSIKGIGALACEGLRNIPDGEVFSCPVKNSVEGHIQFNAPSIYAGVKFENVRLEFSKGKIVKATGSPQKRLTEILATDAGASYIGEFAIACNPFITDPMGDILFDEKIAGSLHFTPGQAYEVADNGNRSAVHWDMVLIQRKEWGGGEIWFDGELIRKDGLFVPKDLKALNPERLAG
jgi:aminopeptidase